MIPSLRDLWTSLRRKPPLPLTLVGYPFRATGRGEHLRAVHRALTTVGAPPQVYDLHLNPELDELEDSELQKHVIDRPPRDGIRLFHCNGDEATDARLALNARRSGSFESGYNIIFPAWELPRYPKVWAPNLDHFDEVWAPTQFVLDSLVGQITVPLFHVRDACQPRITRDLDRAYFGLSDADFVVLFLFDYWSYAARKNPGAVVDVFQQAVALRPNKALRLVMKTSHGSPNSAAATELADALGRLGDRATVIDRTMTDNEIKNLIKSCDCFVSLHRAEGFGRGPAEAMFLGKPTIATGWSGNMDYMNSSVSYPVDYRLIPVGEGEYVHGKGQVWADPDRSQALSALLDLIDDPDLAATVGAKARAHMEANYSDLVLGKHYLDRFEAMRSKPGR